MANPKPYIRLDKNNAAMLLVDHQTGLLSLVRDCELHRDWRNDIEGLGALFSNHIPDYRNLINSFNTFNPSK